MCHETSDCLCKDCTFDVFGLLEKSICLEARTDQVNVKNKKEY